MCQFSWKTINPGKPSETDKLKLFLQDFDLEYGDVDQTYVWFDSTNDKIIATGSIKKNLIKCVAIDHQYQAAGMANTIISRLLETIYEHGYDEAFVVTKNEYDSFFCTMGFFTIFLNEKIAFLTNRKDRFLDYFNTLKQTGQMHIKEKVGAVVVNCNPFTLGHRYLIEKASEKCDWLYIIPVKEDVSLFPYKDRVKMIERGTTFLKNVEIVNGSDYLLSQNTFPSYFIKSADELIIQQTKLDASIFLKYFVPSLNITSRFVGTEPFSHTTNIYNETMKQIFANSSCELIEINRLATKDQQIITATKVREWLVQKNWIAISQFVPQTTLEYLQTDSVEQLVLNNLAKVEKNY